MTFASPAIIPLFTAVLNGETHSPLSRRCTTMVRFSLSRAGFGALVRRVEEWIEVVRMIGSFPDRLVQEYPGVIAD